MAHPPRRRRHSRAPRLAVAASAAAVTASLGPQPAQSQTFAPPVTNPYGLFDVGQNASPTFGDIDGDGDLDAFIGNISGNTLFFENVGTPKDPDFATPQTNPFGLTDVGDFARLTFGDIDGDGDLDAVLGSYCYGNCSAYTRIFFRNSGTAVVPAFTRIKTFDVFTRFEQGFYGVDGGEFALADVDGDGDLDFFELEYSYTSGVIDYDVRFFENTGTQHKPRFGQPRIDPFGLSDLGFIAPAFADIDGDGDLDLFVGAGSGNTGFLENIGTPDDPDFAAPKINYFDLADVGYAARPTFADIDGDGDLDAFIGAGDGHIAFFENVMTSVSVEPPGETAGAHALSAAFPNPFRERTRFRLEVSETQPVRVEVYDALGRIVEVPFDRVVAAGASQDVVCNMESWPAGIYVVRAHGPRFEATRTVVKQP